MRLLALILITQRIIRVIPLKTILTLVSQIIPVPQDTHLLRILDILTLQTRLQTSTHPTILMHLNKRMKESEKKVDSPTDTQRMKRLKIEEHNLIIQDLVDMMNNKKMITEIGMDNKMIDMLEIKTKKIASLIEMREAKTETVDTFEKMETVEIALTEKRRMEIAETDSTEMTKMEIAETDLTEKTKKEIVEIDLIEKTKIELVEIGLTETKRRELVEIGSIETIKIGTIKIDMNKTKGEKIRATHKEANERRKSK
uniref:Uncharacterized protein n=1 Tax=Cacopsylla melanoneura TaxID=428564 RepID=A0A8D9DNM3_9HEMI